MKISDRYVLNEVLPYFLIGLVVFTFVIIMNEFFRFTELVINKGLSIIYVFKMLILSLPFILVLTIPMSMLLAMLMALGRLSNDYEVIAMKSCGLDIFRFLRPLIFFAVITYILTSFIMMELLPWGNHQLRALKVNIMLTKATSGLKAKIFNTDYENTLLYSDDINKNGVMKGVFISDDRDSSMQQIILAEKGYMLPTDGESLVLRLMNGSIHIIESMQKATYDIHRFDVQDIRISMAGGFREDALKKGIKDMTSTELKEYQVDLLRRQKRLQNKIQRIQAKKQPLKADQHHLQIYEDEKDIIQKMYYGSMVEYSKKFSLPFSCVIFALIALPFGIVFSRGGKYSGIAVSLLIILGYYVLLILGESLGKAGVMNPYLSVWLPNVLLGSLAIYLLYRSSIEANASIILKLLKPFDYIRRRKRKNLEGRMNRLPFSDMHSTIMKKIKNISRFLMLLDYYMVTAFLRVFLGVIAISMIIFVVIDAFQVVDDIVKYQSEVHHIFSYLFYRLPTLLVFVLPLSILLSVLLTMGKIANTNELTAMKSLGISIYRLFIPLLVLSLAASLLMLAVQEYVAPPALRKAKDILRFNIRQKSKLHSFVQNKEWYHGIGNKIYNIHMIDPRTIKLYGLTVYAFDENYSMRHIAHCAVAYWDATEKTWVFSRGWLRTFHTDGTISFERFAETKNMPLFREDPAYFITERRDPFQMNYQELEGYINRLELGGYDTTEFHVSLDFKLAFPFVCFVLAFIGFPFALKSSRKGSLFFGVVLSILLAVVYWILLAVFQSLGKAGMLPPFLSSWGANIIFILIGFYLILSVDS